MLDALRRRWPEVVLKNLENEEPVWAMTPEDAADLGRLRRGVEPLRILVIAQRVTRVTVVPAATIQPMPVVA